MTDSISIISPIHQNELHIKNFVESLYAHVIADLKKQKITYEVLLAEDGSTDRTKEILHSLKKKYDFTLFEDSRKLGYAKASKNLIKKAKGSVIFFLDSDGEIDPKSFWKLYDLMKTGKYDLVNGFKLHRKPLYRFFISRTNNLILNTLFWTGVHDANAGCKMYRKKVLAPIVDICSLKYNFNAEQLIRLRNQNRKIVEVGVPHFARESVVFQPNKLFKIVFLALIELFQFRFTLWKEALKIEKK